jgi:ABC-type transport system involved in multi-copper enzyme maturation permease subunit
MNETLITTFWRQRATSVVRMVILFFMVALPLVMLAAMPRVGLAALGDALPLAMLFAVGMIGQDLSSGVLQLVFARPVRRWEYVVCRWVAVAGAAAAVVVAQAAAAWGVLALRGHAPAAELVIDFASGRVLQVVGVASVMALFSSLVAGLADLAVYIVLNILAGIAGLAAQAKGWVALGHTSRLLGDVLAPAIDFRTVAGGGVHAWLEVIAYLSTILLCLAFASVAMNRRELSYASGG